MATTSMDTAKMTEVSKGFGAASDVLKVVSMALEAAIMALKAAAFISFGSTLWMERYLSGIKPKVDQLQKKTGEIEKDIAKAVKNHQAASKAGDSI